MPGPQWWNNNPLYAAQQAQATSRFGSAVGSQLSGSMRGVYAGATPAVQRRTPYGGSLGGPGYGERFYEENQNRWQQPSRGDQYWNAVQGRFTTPYSTPNRGAQAYDAARGYFGSGPQGGVSNARAVSGRLNERGMGEDYAARNSGYFEAPGDMERYFAGVRDQIGRTGAGVENVRGIQGQFNQPGVAEGNYDNARRALSGIRYGDDAVNRATQNAEGFQDTEFFHRGNILPFSGQNPIADEYGHFNEGLRNKSYTEQLYESGGNGGLVDPYQRALDKRTKDVRNAAAARGLFGSGKSLRLEEELAADIGAEEARDRIELARSADDMRLGRTGAALDFAQGIHGAGMDRMDLGLRGAEASDEGRRRNLGLSLDALGMASREALDRVGAETDAADIAQGHQIDRLFRGGQLGLDADRSDMDRIRLGGDLADRSQAAGTERVRTGADITRDAQQLEIDRLYRSGTLGLDADRGERDLHDLYGRMAGDADRTELDANRLDLDRMRAGADISLGLDQEDRYRQNDAFGQAERAQRLQEGRLRGGLQDIQDVNQAQMNAVLSALDPAERMRYEAEIDAINGRAAAEGWSNQQRQNAINTVLQSAATAAQARRPGVPGPGSTG